MTDALGPVPPPPGTTAQAAVDGVTRAARSSFALGMTLLPRRRRRAMRAIYAFCRLVDDIADGALAPADKLALLGAWRDEIGRLRAGAPRSAVGQALAGPVADFDLPCREFLLIVEGMEMDAAGPMVAPSRESLLAYTRRAAGAVGLLSMRVFGAWRGEESERFALALADALQITNILRDVEEDAALGRIYLPAECLAESGVPADAVALAGHPGLPAARARLAEDARAAFGRARALIGVHDRRALLPALAMYGVYRAYFRRMERAGWRFGPAMRMGRLAKLRHGLAGIVAP